MSIETKIRKSGGAAILTIPKPVLMYLGASVGSTVSVDMEDGRMVCKVKEDPMTLESLLADSPKECFELTDEDKEWLHAKPVGKEI